MTTPLDPQLAQVLPFLDYGPVARLSPEAWRGFLRALAMAPNNPPPPAVERIEDASVPGPAGAIPVRIYRPTSAPQPTVVYFHGGGWVGGDLDTHDVVARVLALELGCTVVAVHFRRPPEAPFPAAFDDALAVTRHVGTHLSDFGGEGQRLGVAGDSAGGALAAAVSLACRQEGPTLAGQLLLYPTTDIVGGCRDESVNALFPSRTEHAKGYFITLELMQWAAGHYLGASEASRDPRASPLRAPSLAGLPPTVLCTAQFDPMRDEGLRYATALREAGVEVIQHEGAQLIHAYFALEGASVAAAKEARAVRASFAAILRR